MENIPVFVIHRAVGFVTDHQVKVPAGKELALLILHAVNDIVHGLIGRKDAVSGVVILLFAEVSNGEIGQQIHKAALCLRDQTVAVGKKQDVFHPAMLKQHVAQGNDRPRLAGAGSHDQQRLAAIPGKGIADGLDRALLIVAPGNIAVHHDIFEARPHGLKIEELLQIALGVNRGTPALRVQIVRDVGFKAVGQEDDRAAVILFLQQIGVELCLLAAFGHICAGALGLDHSQRAAVVTVEHIVRITYLGLVGHTGQLDFIQPVLALRPACVFQHGVDIQLAGLVFRQVEGLGHIGLLLLGTAGSEFLLQRSVLRHQRGKINVGCSLIPSRSGRGGLLQQAAVKMSLGVVLTIAVRHKVQKDIEIFQTQHRLLLGDFPAGVGGVVAHTADQIHPPPDVRAHDVPEVLGIHEAHQRVLIRHDQPLVHRVHPLHGKLHRPAAVQHTGGGVNM